MYQHLYELRYLYRDAGNYKFRGSVVIEGYLSLSRLKEFLVDGEYFIPEKIGVPALRPIIQNDDDHLLHEFEEVVPSDAGIAEISSSELISRVISASRNGWF